MEGHKKDKENFYFVIVPRSRNARYPNELAQFLLSAPFSEEELEKTLAYFQRVEHCKKEDIKVEKIYMTLEEFRNIPRGTYVTESEKNSILEKNEKYKPKSPKSLRDIAANKLKEISKNKSHPETRNLKETMTKSPLEIRELFFEKKRSLEKKPRPKEDFSLENMNKKPEKK